MADRKWKSVVGGVVTTYRTQGRTYVVTTSAHGETVKSVADQTAELGEVSVPKWIELTTSGSATPDHHVRVEVRDGSPEVVQIGWTARVGQRNIRKKDLTDVDLAKLAMDLYSGYFAGTHPFPEGPGGSFPTDDQIDEWAAQVRKSRQAARNFVDRQRRPREHRPINDDLLKLVASVYRTNIDKRAPTQAVAKHLGVGGRMASTYVQKARARGYLGPTKRGKKQA